MNMKILLLSGYDAVSHKYWRELLAKNLPEFEWTQLALPDRYFQWRVRGNSLTFAKKFADILSRDYDLLIVTSMVDLVSLRGMVPKLASIPNLVYCHENQFDYPVTAHQSEMINIQLTNIYTLVCADRVIFNSAYNLATSLSGVRNFLKKMPDEVPDNLVELIESKSFVLPVPIESQPENAKEKRAPMPVILWNHRWEYDKQPEVFFEALTRLKSAGYKFRLNILGQSFRKQPECFEKARERLKDEILNWGYQPKAVYWKCLSQSDIVVSTALHDFQGLSTLEAIHCGATPVVPDRVAYPEYVPDSLRYKLGEGIDEAEQLFSLLVSLLNHNQLPEVDVSQYLTSNIIPQYRKQIIDLLGNTSETRV
ncbi:DUF3524 domain-containing protein [Aliikangiella sp. G2MR2-5]|uniref:tRNA-queuosine alpha-mannosyltransferase domain-containing protein n=1 Tax=Aliikangiella sp. G2MR2-5 TaxID=2788943 RepID=UPI001AEEB362|nr:DUF3524 domain-containing protein [Aliikangiella sp. G2MR2-5]